MEVAEVMENLENSEEFQHHSRPITIAEFINQKVLAMEKEIGIEDQRGENLSGWGCVTDLIIEKIFSYLSIGERSTASIVCKQWHRAFYMQATWNTFELDDYTLTRRKFDYYMGWRDVLDHLRAQRCLLRVGQFIRILILSPMTNLKNLFEFMNMISYCSEKYLEDKTGPWLKMKIYSFRFIFSCDFANRQDHYVYGTGGELLESLKRLMKNLNEIRNLELIDLLLDSFHEAIHFLDNVCIQLCEQLIRLVLINATKLQLNLIHPGCFVNLRILKISPQNLGNELVQLLASNLRLEELHIIQNNYTESGEPVDPKYWANAKFKVYLRTLGKKDKEIIWQAKAPVVSIIYDCSFTKVSWTSAITATDLYLNRLEEYGHLSLPKFGRSKKFDDRPDTILLGLCRKCPYLNILYVRERISTSTALLIVAMSPNLRHFYLRRNAVILKCDYKHHNLELDFNFTQWVQLNSRSYEKMSAAISKILGYDWKPLSDTNFKEICKLRQAY